jgi:hypothetical protein
VTLNLTEIEAEALRVVLRDRRRCILLDKDVRRWHTWPEGKIYAKLCKLLGKKR